MQKYKDKSLNIEERIDDLLSKMTNEEKPTTNTTPQKNGAIQKHTTTTSIPKI